MTTSELITEYESDLRALQRIAHRRRDSELANEREEICLNLSVVRCFGTDWRFD